MIIKPTVGRKVWYRPFPHERAFSNEQPHDATVVHVWSEHCVNLVIYNENGTPTAKTSVILAQERRAAEGECEWMPFQVGQARAQTENPPLVSGAQTPRPDSANRPSIVDSE